MGFDKKLFKIFLGVVLLSGIVGIFLKVTPIFRQTVSSKPFNKQMILPAKTAKNIKTDKVITQEREPASQDQSENLLDKSKEKIHSSGQIQTFSPNTSDSLDSKQRVAIFSEKELNKKNRAILKTVKIENKRFEKSRGEKYQKLMNQENMPKSGKTALIGVDPLTGIPKFYQRLNWDGARTIKTANIWASSSMNPVTPPIYSIDGGSGIKFIGMWDGGSVKTSHVEFGSRVKVMDGSSSDDHATHVAGTLVASGQYYYGPSGSRYQIPGMAYGGYLASYDWLNDVSEFAAAALNNGLDFGVNGKSQMYASNHSYGTSTGWIFDGDEDTCSGDWYWYGVPSVDSDEDYKFGAYLTDTQSIDNALYNAPYLVQAWAAGNARDDEGPTGATCPKSSWYELNSSGSFVIKTSNAPNANNFDGGYDTLTPESSAKNVITVGAVEKAVTYVNPNSVVHSEFSSFGPTDDGRIKPDIVAPGVDIKSTYYESSTSYAAASSGTSMASPHIAGSVALLQSLFYRYNSRYPLSSTIKALILHTAREAGPFNGPDYQYGFGLPDFDEAAKLIYNDSLSGKTYIVESTLSNQEVEEFIVKTNGQIPKVTLVWTDPAHVSPGNVLDPSSKMLINDLNLRLIDSSGINHYPWKLNKSSPTDAATRGNNDTDNVEKIEATTTPLSNQTWRIRVSHSGTLQSNQTYSLVYSNLEVSSDEQKVSIYNPTTSATLTLNGGEVTVDMGSILSSQSKTQLIRIYNTSSSNLTLAGLSITPALFSYSLDKTTVTTGDYATVSVLFNPSGSTGTYQGILSFTTNDTVNPSIKINYNVQSNSNPTPQIRIEYINTLGSSTETSSGDILTVASKRAQSGVNETHKIKIKNTGTGNLTLSSFSTMSSPFAWNRPADQTLTPDASMEFPFTLSLNGAGEFNQTLSFSTNVTGKETISLFLKANLSATSNPSLELKLVDSENVITSGQSATVLLGSVAAYNSSSFNLTLKNTGNVDLTLSNFTDSGTDQNNFMWEQTLSTLAIGDTATLKIKFTADDTKDYFANMSFNWKETGTSIDSTFTFLVQIKVTGQPALSITYNGSNVAYNNFIPVDLGAMSIKDMGQSSNSRTLVLSNTGGAPLEIKEVSVPSPFQVTTYPSTNILEGQSSNLKIKFSSTIPGEYSGYVKMKTNISNNAEISLMISSRVTGPKVSFNYQAEGIYREKYHFYILNSGYLEDLSITYIDLPYGFLLYEDGPRTITPGSTGVFRVKMDESIGLGYRSGMVTFTTNDTTKYQTTVMLTSGNAADGIVSEEGAEEKKKSTKNTPVVGCATINLDHNNDPKNQLPVISLGFILAFMMGQLKRKVFRR